MNISVDDNMYISLDDNIHILVDENPGIVGVAPFYELSGPRWEGNVPNSICP